MPTQVVVGIAAGAAALFLVLGGLAVLVLSGGDDDATDVASTSGGSGGGGEETVEAGGAGGAGGSDEEGAEPAATSPTGPVGPLPVTVRSATAERESVFLRCTDQYVDYSAGNLVDGSLDTGWGAGADDGTGQSITLDFGQPVAVTRVGLTPGYAKFGPRQDQGCASVDAFPFNRYVTGVRYTFDDGSSVEQTFTQSGALQWQDVDVAETSSVTITILGTQLPPGADDDTILSEAQFEGRPVAA